MGLMLVLGELDGMKKVTGKRAYLFFRTKDHRWDPKSQRPELWNIYNTKIDSGESIRVFPLSNWTELDVWQYIKQEQIDVVPLYFAKSDRLFAETTHDNG